MRPWANESLLRSSAPKDSRSYRTWNLQNPGHPPVRRELLLSQALREDGVTRRFPRTEERLRPTREAGREREEAPRRGSSKGTSRNARRPPLPTGAPSLSASRVAACVTRPFEDLVGEAGAQLAFEDLAGRVAQQVVHEEDVLGDFEGGEALAGADAQLLGEGFVRLRPALERHYGADGLDPLLVRQRHDRDLRDGLVVVQDVLDLPPRDQNAAGVYDVLDPVDDVEVAPLVNIAQVAGVEPTAREGFFGLLGLVPVADHELRGAVHDLPVLAGPNVVHLRIHHARADVEDRLAGGGQLLLVVLLGTEDGGQRRDLALSVAVVKPGGR